MALIMISGNPAVRVLDLNLITILMFLMGGLLFISRPIYITSRGVLVVALSVLLLVAQAIVFGEQVFAASIGFLLHLLIGFMVISSIPRFLSYFVNCMVLIAIVSLPVFFFFQVLGNLELLQPFIVYEQTLGYREINVGFHNFRGAPISTRNSGPFWEPGAFAGYLAIALYCMVLQAEHRRPSILAATLLIFALLTTQSTMGYVALLLVAFAFLSQKFRKTNLLVTVIALPITAAILIAGAQTAAERIPFLQDKIEEQIQEANDGTNNPEINRFGNAEYDWQFIKQRPLIGWSANVDTRASVDPLAYGIINAQGNALSGLAARFGILGWLLFMGSFFMGYYRASSSFVLAGIGFGILATTFTGEKYMNYPLIMTFMFLERHHIFLNSLVTKRGQNKHAVSLGIRLTRLFRNSN